MILIHVNIETLILFEFILYIRCVVCKRRYKGAIQGMSSNIPVRMTDIDDKSDQEEVSKVEEAPAYENYNIKPGIEKPAALDIRYEPGNQYNCPKSEKAGQYADINHASLSDVNVYDTPQVHCY